MEKGDIRRVLSATLDSPTRKLDVFEADSDVPIKSIRGFARILGCQVRRQKKRTFIICGEKR